jgi:hypothetical protein
VITCAIWNIATAGFQGAAAGRRRQLARFELQPIELTIISSNPSHFA